MNGLILLKNDIKKRKKYNPDNYYSFGKFIINKKLLNKHILLVKYPISYAPIPKIKRQDISNELQTLLIDLIDTQEINKQIQKNLNIHDMQLFETIINLSGLKQQLKYNRIYKTVQDHMDRFIILQGALNAGNHNIVIINELINIIDILNNESIGVISNEDSKMLKDCLL